MKIKFFLPTLLIIIAMVLVPAYIEVSQEYKENLNLVFEKKVVETTFKCIKEGNCNYGNTSLSKLYSLNYLEKQYNPVTKAYYNDESYIYYSTEESYFIEIT